MDETYLEHGTQNVKPLRATERLGKCYFFTSLTPWSREKKDRHEIFMAAQEAFGVKVVKARFKQNRRYCRSQNRRCKFWEEKESDVAIAVQVLADAYAGEMRRAVLVTADTDQIPTVKHLLSKFRHIEVTVAVPPDRKDEAREMTALLHRPAVEIDLGRLKACLLPQRIPLPGGKHLEMPPAYAPTLPEPA